MNVVVLYAHPNPKSFSHALLETVSGELAAAGHSVVVRDLYELGFDPVLKGSDFTALRSGETPADILREQGFVRDADLVVAVHPVWWFGMPAILKGYIDRVFCHGFAYSFGADGVKGLLKGKKALVLNTTGGDEGGYDGHGFKDALLKTVDAGVYGFCGMEVVHHHFCFAVQTAGEDVRKSMLDGVRCMLKEKLSN